MKKKNFRKFQSEISSIFWNPQKSFFDPKIHIFDPRTPKFGILVQNRVTIHIFLEFLKNVENRPFFRFLNIFGIFRFSRDAGPAKVRLRQNWSQKFSFFVFLLNMQKYRKFGLKKIWGGPPPLKSCTLFLVTRIVLSVNM